MSSVFYYICGKVEKIGDFIMFLWNFKKRFEENENKQTQILEAIKAEEKSRFDESNGIKYCPEPGCGKQMSVDISRREFWIYKCNHCNKFVKHEK